MGSLFDTSGKGDDSCLGAIKHCLLALKAGVCPVASFLGKEKLF